MYSKVLKPKIIFNLEYKLKYDSFLKSIVKIDKNDFQFSKWSEVHNKYHKQYLVKEFCDNQIKLNGKTREKLYQYIIECINGKTLKSANFIMVDNHIESITNLVINYGTKTGETTFLIDQYNDNENDEKDINKVSLFNIEWQKYINKIEQNTKKNYGSHSLGGSCSSVSLFNSDNSLDMSDEIAEELEGVEEGIDDDNCDEGVDSELIDFDNTDF
jgi:hypothetical protein